MAALNGSRGRWPLVAIGLAVILAVAPVTPPLSGLAIRHSWAEALSFAILAVVVPVLVALGAPWQLIGLGATATRLADSRRRHPEILRTVAVLMLAAAADVAWRTPYAVERVVHDRRLVVLEAVTLIATGTALWLELVESPPLLPRSPRTTRIAVAALAMWTIWILAYVLGMASGSPYAVHHHHLADAVGRATDSQIATGLLWFIAGCAFIPVVFSNLLRWLRSEENPDEELHRLVSEERRRGRGGF